MPVIFLAVRAVRFVKFVRFPAFRALSPSFQRGILVRMAKEAAIGAAIRGVGEFALLMVIDPYNRIVVPLSGDRLITTSQASSSLLAFEGGPKRAAQIVAAAYLAPVDLTIDIGIDLIKGGINITKQAFREAEQGFSAIVGIAKGKLTF